MRQITMSNINRSADSSIQITPSDTVRLARDLPGERAQFRAIFVGVGGTIVGLLARDEQLALQAGVAASAIAAGSCQYDRAFSGLQTGAVYPLCFTYIRSTGTTAGAILGLD